MICFPKVVFRLEHFWLNFCDNWSEVIFASCSSSNKNREPAKKPSLENFFQVLIVFSFFCISTEIFTKVFQKFQFIFFKKFHKRWKYLWRVNKDYDICLARDLNHADLGPIFAKLSYLYGPKRVVFLENFLGSFPFVREIKGFLFRNWREKMSEFQKLLQKKKAERDRNIEKMDIGKKLTKFQHQLWIK